MKKHLSIRNLSHSYHDSPDGAPVLVNLSFQMMEGEFLSVMGPPGCGKSTLLSLIAGLLPIHTGTVDMDGTNLLESGQNIGYVLQNDPRTDCFHINDAISGLEVHRQFAGAGYLLLNQLTDSYSLVAFRNSKLAPPSDAARQRASLIRFLLLQTDVLLLDEPFSSLDATTRLEMGSEVWQAIRRENKTTLLVTDDVEEAVSMSDRILVLTDGPATLKRDVPVRLTLQGARNPLASRDAADFGQCVEMVRRELL